MPKIIDISVPLHSDMPIWPGSVGLQISRTQSLESGDEANVSRLDCDVHIGTHVDAPLHFIEGGVSVDQLPLEVLCGPAAVADLTGADSITADDLAALSLPENTTRLLLKTPNSTLWQRQQSFDANYAALTADAARWIVERGIRLVGIDYLSVEGYYDGCEVHRILLEAEVVIIEGLNLIGVVAAHYELLCLPLKLVGAEGAPARAVLVGSEE